MACLEHATQLDPVVQEMVTSRASDLVPPRCREEAYRLAKAGPVVLELLPPPDDLTPAEAVDVVETIKRVGDDAGLALLAEFCKFDDAQVQRSIAQGWSRFDHSTFADIILPHLRTDIEISVSNSDQLTHPNLQGRFLTSFDLTPQEIIEAGVADQLRVAHFDQPVDLAPLERSKNLTHASFISAQQETDLTPLARLLLKSLHLDLAADCEVLGLELLTHVRNVSVRLHRTQDPLNQLPQAAPVTWLILAEPPEGGAVELSKLRRLRALTLWGREPLSSTGWTAIEEHKNLERLYIDAAALQLGTIGRIFPRVTHLTLAHAKKSDINLDLLADSFPRLTTITLTEVYELDLAPLSKLHGLKRVELSRAHSYKHADALESIELKVTAGPRYN